MIRILLTRHCRMVCLVHDLDSLRQVHHAWSLEVEVARLNAFDLVIVHNRQMQDLLQANGLRVETACLDLFDYLVPAGVLDSIALKNAANLRYAGPRNRIVFAGNLGKSEFLPRLLQLPSLCFKVYGPGYATGHAPTNIHWAGAYDANELPAAINGDFGLIWDGPDLHACTGNLGKYLRYNNPHKASLYLLSRLPLIAPKGSAIGRFIEANRIGITINSLLDLPSCLASLKEADYLQMLDNLAAIADAIATGGFLRKQVENL